MAANELRPGTITLLLTDVEGSTALWDRGAAQMSVAMRRHDEISEKVICRFNGRLIKQRGEGDSLFAVFDTGTDAIAAAIDLQRGMGEENWSTGEPIRMRIALHSGDVECREGDFYGPVVNRCARIRALAHGGQILVSNATEELVRECLPDGANLIDLGMHRLRDLSREERIFQLCHGGLQSNFPPLRSLQMRPNNLPVQLTSFVGRGAELAQALDLLEKCRLLTLTGAGGSGKTRLALQVAAELIDAFPDGVWFVDLVGLHDPNLLVARVCEVVGVRIASSDPVADLQHGLREKSMLLLLDNCEHLASAAGQVVDGLLHSTTHLKILVTSRQALSVPGEQLYPVPPMKSPRREERGLASKLLTSDAGKLFVERARAVRPEFSIEPKNAPAIAELCAKLDGIPLAIELAAARARLLSPEQILERLDDRFILLRDTRQFVDPRHRTLRATLDWSFELLSKPEKALFIKLAVFAGGWNLEAAERVCANKSLKSDAIVNLLDSLVDRSLVVPQQRPGRPMRYRLLETVREYALENAAWKKADELRLQHFRWCLDSVENLEALAAGSSQGQAFDQLTADLDNVRNALEFGLERSDLAAGTLKLATLLHSFWVASGHYEEGRGWLTAALKACPNCDKALRARAINLSGVLAMMQGDLSGAVPFFEQSLVLRRKAKDKSGEAATLVNLGMLAWELDQPETALERFKSGAELFRSLDKRGYLGMALLNLGCVLSDQVRGEEAVCALRESIDLLEESGDDSSQAVAAANLAHEYLRAGQAENARTFVLKGLNASKRSRHVLSAHECLLVAAHIQMKARRPSEAATLYGAARKLYESHGEKATPRRAIKWDELETDVLKILDKDAFELARVEGARMDLDSALDLALSGLNS